MRLISVTDKKTALEFLQVAVVIYKNEPNWIRPLDKDINDVFCKEKNKAFRFGEAARWILKDEKGNLIGRIAAFTNKKYKNKILKQTSCSLIDQHVCEATWSRFFFEHRVCRTTCL